MKRQPEQELQRQVVHYLQSVNPRCLWFAVPNGGQRSQVEAAIFKGLGVKAGVPDLVFLAGGLGAGIELKAGKGQQSPGQVLVEEQCRLLGVPYRVCRSLEDVHAALVAWRLVDADRVSVGGAR